MKDKYDLMEAAFLGRWLRVTKRYGYICNWTLDEIQELIKGITYYYNTDSINRDLDLEDKKMYFENVMAALSPHLTYLLKGYYRGGGWMYYDANTDLEEESNNIYPFVLLKKKGLDDIDPSKKRLREVAAYETVTFEHVTGKILSAPQEFEGVETLDDLVLNYIDNEKYDLKELQEIINLHKTDLQLRDMIVESAGLRLIAGDIDENKPLEDKYERVLTMLDSMIVNIPNFTSYEGMEARLYQTYESSKDYVSNRVLKKEL